MSTTHCINYYEMMENGIVVAHHYFGRLRLAASLRVCANKEQNNETNYSTVVVKSRVQYLLAWHMILKIKD